MGRRDVHVDHGYRDVDRTYSSNVTIKSSETVIMYGQELRRRVASRQTERYSDNNDITSVAV